MDYWELRKLVQKIIPRRSSFEKFKKIHSYVKEKGRKKNYREFNLVSGLNKKERLLNKDEIKSFIEISLRAAHCPLCLNLDTVDGVRCGFYCVYCYADLFRASLYTSFFDNSSEIGYRFCNPDFFKREMDVHLKYRGNISQAKTDIQRALALEMPLRFGIRFEDFLPIEAKKKVSLEMLKYLAQNSYPVMLNTKSDLVGKHEYVKALSDNKGRAAVHITMISCDNEFLKRIEPGAPSFDKRLETAKILIDAGIRVVARIEPFMIFLNDSRDMVDEYIQKIKSAGIKHLTLDTFSYSAGGAGIRRNFEHLGYDFQRMFTLMSDCQWLGSLILGRFMYYLRDNGFEASTFDFGNVPSNDDPVCCSVGDWFSGRSCGNTVTAIRFIASKNGLPVTWEMYEDYVLANGGWLSERLRRDVMEAWCGVGNQAYMPWWGQGITPIGISTGGKPIFVYNKIVDFREQLFKELL